MDVRALWGTVLASNAVSAVLARSRAICLLGRVRRSDLRSTVSDRLELVSKSLTDGVDERSESVQVLEVARPLGCLGIARSKT